MDWTWAGYWWLAWLLIGFLPIELWAAVKTKGTPDTFSEFVWWAFGIRPRKTGHAVKAQRFRQLILAGFMISLSTHFVLGWGPQGIILFGVPVAAIIGYSTLKERSTK
jgi:hypothetical protein